ncbi:MAG: type II toxin-antitoxin system HicA family toxin [Ignavibacteria bacterium]
MNKLSPIANQQWIKFIESVGCVYKRQKDNHLIYTRPDLKRPIVFRNTGDIPIFHIKNCLRTLNIKTSQFLKIIDNLNKNS